MYNKTGMQCWPDQRGNAGRREDDTGFKQCIERCCNPGLGSPQWMGHTQNQRARNYEDPFFGPPSGGSQMRYSPQQFQGRAMTDRKQPYMDLYMRSSPFSSTRRVPSYDPYDSLYVNQSARDECGNLENNQSMAGDWSGFAGSPWTSTKLDDSSCKDWTNVGADNPFTSGYPESGWPSQNSSLGQNAMRPPPARQNLDARKQYAEGCSLNGRTSSPQSLLSRFMNMIRPPPPQCPLNPPTGNARSKNPGPGGSSNSFFRPRGTNQQFEDHFSSLDDLWNPRKIRRWDSVSNWDQHKESLWKQVIENKLGSCGPAGRSIENKVHEALDALHQEGADCIAFRMFYGILKRNEDVYLNPYIQLMTDEEFLKLIVALNNFYFEDKDKRKEFLNHPPPTWIEKIMQKETLSIIDPTSRAPYVVRRFWEALLDWYIRKLVEKGDPSAQCPSDRTASQSSFGGC